jgi:hypothetical protein
MECKHNEKTELLFCNRVEDRLDLKEPVQIQSLFTSDAWEMTAEEMELDGPQNG